MKYDTGRYIVVKEGKELFEGSHLGAKIVQEVCGGVIYCLLEW